MGAGGALLVVCLMLCATLGVPARTSGATKQKAVCQLVLKGYGNKEGLKYGSLNCSTHDGSPLVVGVDRRYVGDKIQTEGVVLRDNWTECVPTSEVGPKTELPLPLVKSGAILSFCGAYHLEFQSMLIIHLYRSNYTQCAPSLPGLVSVAAAYPCWVLRLSGVDGVIVNGTLGINSAGSVIGMTDTRLVVKNSRFFGNEAASGAAIAAWSGNSLALIDCGFWVNVAYGKDNLASGRGSIGGRRQVVVHNLPTRQINVPSLWGLGEGGAVLVYNGSVHIVNSTFEGNVAEMGGALLVDYNVSGISVTESIFDNNAAVFGGAIYAGLTYDDPSVDGIPVLVDSTHFNYSGACVGASLYVNGRYSYTYLSGEFGLRRVRLSNCTFNSSQPYMEVGVCNGGDGASISVYSVYHLQIIDSSIRDSWCTGVACFTADSSRGGGCQITSSNISGSGFRSYMWEFQVGYEWSTKTNNDCSAVEASTTVVDGASLITNNTGLYGAGIHVRDYLRVRTVLMPTYPDGPGPGALPPIEFSDPSLGIGEVKLLMPSRMNDNNATVAGGGLFCDNPNCTITYDTPHLGKIVYKNAAPVAPDAFVPPHTLTLLNGGLDAFGSPLIKSAFTSDDFVPINIQVTGAAGIAVENVSYIAQVASGNLSGRSALHYFNTTSPGGVVTFMLRVPLGVYNVSMSLYAFPGSPYLPYMAGLPDAVTKSFELILLRCNVGQIVSYDGVCRSCPRGSYSVHLGAIECNPCPVDSASCPGGALIVPRLGYWHSMRLATQLHKCPNQDACQHSSSQNFHDISQACRDPVITAGGLAKGHTACQQLQKFTMRMSNSTYSDLQCSTGYAGNVCGACQRDRGYVLVKPFLCKKCSQPGMIVSIFVVGWVLLLSMIKLLCYLTLRDVPAAISGATSSATFILKPFILYMQYMLIIGTLIVQWPIPISAGFLALSVLFSSAAGETISIGCLLSSTPAWPVAIRRTLFYLSMPFVTLAALLLCECAWHACRNVSRRARTRTQHITLTDHLLSSSMVVLFFFLPSLARTTLSLFACLEVDKFDAPDVAQDAMGSFWMFDMSQRCYHGYHRGWALGLGIPLAVLLCAGLPLTILCVVFSKHSDNSTHHFGFLYRMYRPSHRYWEAVVTLQTLVLIAISVFGYNVGVYAQVVMMSFALAVILIMLVVVKPYAQPASHLVMCYGITCTLVTSYLALTMWTDNLFPGFAPGDRYRIAAASFVLLMNLLYIVFVVRELLRCVCWKTMTSTAVAKAHGMWQRLSQTSWALSH